MAAKPHSHHLPNGLIADPAWAFGANPALVMTEDETQALRYILGVVAAEADRMEDSDAEAWAKHAAAIGPATARSASVSVPGGRGCGPAQPGN